ncbi:MAG TPA: UDP-N-acetylenolpyruvoylglucosamine reductase [Clostridiales bacterium]|nr:MAG: UDP-N-acetylenolpyruvoylglucosamine reductase [Clostridiales bacterium GWD2_32_19]HCC07949.1 UDP-N-acetylenolpyruvoylglucosamine reductase [Clostridiales bacterium]
MNKNDIIEQLKERIDTRNIFIDEILAKHTTYKIGGAADIFVVPQNKDELIHSVKVCRENNVEHVILGKGSNVLVADDGFRGVVINTGDNLSKIEINDDEIYAEAGAGLISVSYKAYDSSLVGLEFACGIPGTIGGAICMNAGAYGGDMKQVVTEVEVIDEKNEIRIINNDEMKFAYRHSIVQEKDYIVLSVKMKLMKGNKEEIKEIRERLKTHRINGQPLDMPNAGSVFIRPDGYYPGKMIEDLGLKGYTIGGAQVSEKHANFIVNIGNAKATDVLELIEYVNNELQKGYGMRLGVEIKKLGICEK